MNKKDIRFININQERSMVYFHLHNGKTITRTITHDDLSRLIKAKRVHDNFVQLAVDMFNTKYLKPQKIEVPNISKSDEMFFTQRAVRLTQL